MKIVVIGANGMLGQDVVREFAPDHDILRTTTDGKDADYKLDICDEAETLAILEQAGGDLVVNCAAYTAVDKCETESEIAHLVNGAGAGNIGKACARLGTPLFHISTDYVFDGEKGEAYLEEDEPNPMSVYGASKLAGEEAVRASGCTWYIGRVQWLYGAGGPNFADTMLRLAKEMPALKVVDDQHGCPTWTAEVARCMRRIIEEGEPGLYHMTAQGQTTWYGFTRALLAAAGLGDVPVEPCTTDEFPRPAHRPKNSVLRNERLARTIGDQMRPWDAVIDEYLRSRS